MTAGSNALASKQSDSWRDLPQADQTQTATRLLSTVEESAFQVAKTIKEPETVVDININIGQCTVLKGHIVL